MSNVDDTFKNALEGYTELPNPELWDRISAAVDEHGTGGSETGHSEQSTAKEEAPSRRTGLFVVWRKQLLATASAAATIALLWTVSWTPTPSYDSRELRDISGVSDERSTQDGVWSPIKAALEAQETEQVVQVEVPETVVKQRPLAPRWEARLEDHEVELAMSEELLQLDIVRSEFIQEQTKVEVNFVPTETKYYADATPGKVSRVLGTGAKTVGENMAKIIGKGYLNWETAKVSVNHTLATIQSRKTPKNK